MEPMCTAMCSLLPPLLNNLSRTIVTFHGGLYALSSALVATSAAAAPLFRVVFDR